MEIGDSNVRKDLQDGLKVKLPAPGSKYAHGVWQDFSGVEPVPLDPTQVMFTEGAKTNFELWQMERKGNYVKAQGTEYLERFIDSKKD